jgi:YjbE family integral membrane protein
MPADAQFWAAFTHAAFINLVLSVDNAAVLALMVSALPPRERLRALLLGAGLMVVTRIPLTLVAVHVLRWPLVKIVGAMLLLWMAVRLLAHAQDAQAVQPMHERGRAIRAIVVADSVMSIDNVLAVAAAAGGQWLALGASLAATIPAVVCFAELFSRLMQRWPVILWTGAALLGWVAGGIALGDPLWASWIAERAASMYIEADGWRIAWTQLLGAVLVTVVGAAQARKRRARGGAG